MAISCKKILAILSYALLFIIIIGITLYYEKDIFNSFSQLKWWMIFLMLLLQIPMIAFGGLAFKLLSIRYDIHIRWQDWIGLSFIANLLNQLLPYRPGLLFRYLYLHQHYHMKSAEFFFLMLVYFLLTVAVSAGFTLTGWLTSSLPHQFDKITLLILVLLIFISGFIFFLIRNKPQNEVFSTKPFSHHLLHKSLTALNTLLNKPAILLGATFSLILMNLFAALIFYLAFIATGSPLPFGHCLFLIGIVVFAMIFPITPGNIGVLEALIGTLTQIMYQDFGIGFSVTALFRATQWIPSLIFGTSFSFLLIGNIIPRIHHLNLGAHKRVD